MRYEIKSLGIWSFVRVSFFINLIVGFLAGLLYAGLLGLIFAAAGSVGDLEDLPFDPSAVGPIILILLPIIFAVGCAFFNTLLGVVVVVAYNLMARMTGGFEMELGLVETASPKTPSSTVPSAVPPPPPSWNPPPPPPNYDPPRDRGPEPA